MMKKALRFALFGLVLILTIPVLACGVLPNPTLITEPIPPGSPPSTPSDNGTSVTSPPASDVIPPSSPPSTSYYSEPWSPTQIEPGQLPEGKYVGSKKDNVYHYPTCILVKQIKQEDLIGFASETEAQDEKYRACTVCNPPSIAPDMKKLATDPCYDATAICNDGTCSYNEHRSGTCSRHGGVKHWINVPPD